MEKRKLGKSDMDATKICLGTWAVGGGPWWGDSDDQESIRAIQATVDAGINFIDTAPAYGFGHSEEVVGKAVKGMRDKVIISTKCGLWWKGEEGTPFFEMDGYSVRRSLQPKTIRTEIEDSLRRLDTDYIDLYITHWQEEGDSPTPIADTIGCLEDLKKEGKIRAIGASNTSLDNIKEYTKHGQLDAIQERYTMLDRTLEPAYVDLCQKSGVGIMAYSTLEQGLLTGKIGMDAEFGEEEFRSQLDWLKQVNRKKVLDMLATWEDITKKYDCSLAQLVIAWTTAQRGITYTLVGARKLKHAEENAKAGGLALEDADLKRMRNDVEALGQPQ